MKQCAVCGEFKPIEEYSYRNKLLGRRWGTCKSCQSVQQKEWYKNNKARHKETVKRNRQKTIAEAQQYIWDYLSTHPCVDCGESNPIVLEFDHIRGRKKKAVGDMARAGYSIGAVQKEIEKCEIRCANCHRIKTHQERGWFRG